MVAPECYFSAGIYNVQSDSNIYGSSRSRLLQIWRQAKISRRVDRRSEIIKDGSARGPREAEVSLVVWSRNENIIADSCMIPSDQCVYDGGQCKKRCESAV